MSLLRTCIRASLASKQVASPTPSGAIRPFANTAAEQAESNTSSESSKVVAPLEPVRDVTVADVISGAPSELRHRAVRVYQPTRNTMQSGAGKSERWRVDFDVLQGGGRWENPLMGWASSADYMQGTRMSFRSKEDAIHFVEKQGWDYYVQEPTIKRIPPKNYAENYVYKPHQLRIMRTK